MNSKRLTWLAITLLIVMIAWAILSLRKDYEKITAIDVKGSEDLIQYIAATQKNIASQREYIKKLEKIALWPIQADIMSWLTQQADNLSVKVIGVEYLPVEKLSKYQSININLSVRGNYNDLGRFINALERSPYAVGINSFRMLRKESTPEYITMNISLSCIKIL